MFKGSSLERQENLSLECINITKRFGALEALRNVSYSILPNKINCIIGPNGAGKTTLLNVLTGFIKPDAGKIIFAKNDITNWPAYKRAQLGLVRTFQLTSIFSKLTVYENLQITRSLSLFSPPKSSVRDYKEKIFSIVKLVGLEDKLDCLAEKLSYGDKKKLEIAMALCKDPVVLMLDEPLAGLPDVEIQEVTNILMQLKMATSILLIEHKVSKILDLADRLTVLAEGSIIYDGKPDEALEDPKVIQAYWKTGTVAE
jgi:branched-chain amino acid transport system ATP-binding protein